MPRKVEISGLSKWFGELEALRQIDVAVEHGEFISVVGPSGCGKTTFLRMVAGLEPATSGTILIDGQPLRGPGNNRGFVFQNDSLLPWRTVLANAVIGPEVAGKVGDRERQRTLDLLKLVGLGGFENYYPRQLSGGMRQRVSLVRTLVHDPSVILMDEPFGALDALTRLQVRMDLEALWLRRRPTVLFITHSVEEAVGLSDRILVMSPSPGEVVEEIEVALPRPRPIVLGDAPEFAAYVDRIHKHFERMGVLQTVVAGTSPQ
jgi:NitT/TauT family transport system ATP-binding protein